VSWATLCIFNGSLVSVIGCLVGLSIGATVMFVATPAVIMETVPAKETGRATGFAYLVRAQGLGVETQPGALLLGSSLVVAPSGDSVFPSPGAFKLAIGLVAITSLLAMLFAIAVPKADGTTEDDVVSTGASGLS
jgi:MFS family permease